MNPCLSSPLSLCKIVKQFFQRIQRCETRCVILIPKWVICPKHEIFGKVITMTSIFQNFKFFFNGSRVMRMCHFWIQTIFFFGKPVNKPVSYHSCLSTFQKSKSDINLLMKYWRLKNSEISLVKSHFWP